MATTAPSQSAQVARVIQLIHNVADSNHLALSNLHLSVFLEHPPYVFPNRMGFGAVPANYHSDMQMAVQRHQQATGYNGNSHGAATTPLYAHSGSQDQGSRTPFRVSSKTSTSTNDIIGQVNGAFNSVEVSSFYNDNLIVWETRY